MIPLNKTHKLKYFFCGFYKNTLLLPTIFIIVLLDSTPTLAFDDDKTINDIHLKDESFLDINAHQFRKSLDMQWLNTLNGWRATGGSVSTDRLYTHNDFRLHQELSRVLSFGMELEQENFYGKKPMPLPLFYADIYPGYTYDIGVSITGTPAYDKRQSDLGYAITIGRRPYNYTRLSWLKVDKYYNEKNEFDDSYYTEFAETWIVEGRYLLKHGWSVHYNLKKDTPMDFVFDNQTSRFMHESYDFKINLAYHITPKQIAGINIRSLNIDKQLQQTTSDEEQKIDYQMLDAYWINTRFNGNNELTVGFRYDLFKEKLQDYLAAANSYHFKLSTWQIYSTLYHTYSPHQAWDLGLYLAWSDRFKKYDTSGNYEFNNDGIQAKLRTSWQYHAIDKSSVLLLSMTFNLDDLLDDPGDGGGMYFQTRF